MNKLDDILSILEKYERQNELLKYAKSLGVNTSSVVVGRGEVNEEKLAILIFDAQKNRRLRKTHNFNFLGMGIVVTSLLLLLIGTMPQLLLDLYENEQVKEENQGRVLQGFDDKGQPMMQDGQPVMFKAMEGTYSQYRDDGSLEYVYYYESGELISRKEFDKNGRVIKEDRY